MKTVEQSTNNMLIQGIVLCKKCDGQIISNTGKVMLNSTDMTLKCWRCGREVSSTTAYNKRKENHTVKI